MVLMSDGLPKPEDGDSLSNVLYHAQQAKNANPDLLFIAWAGTTGGAMFKTLDQQGVLTGTQVVTGLAERATWNAFGDPATKINFLSHYVYTAPNNKINTWLTAQLRKKNQVPDIFTPARQSGTSAGGGVRVAWEDIYSADLQVAKAVQGPRDDWRFFVVLGAKY